MRTILHLPLGQADFTDYGRTSGPDDGPEGSGVFRRRYHIYRMFWSEGSAGIRPPRLFKGGADGEHGERATGDPRATILAGATDRDAPPIIASMRAAKVVSIFRTGVGVAATPRSWGGGTRTGGHGPVSSITYRNK